LATKINPIEKHKLRKLISELKKKEGRGTELISLYIPPNKRISDVISYLREEYSTASNIKSDQTRKNVQDALVKVMERLKYFDVSPENGLAVFCGAIPQNGPGSEKMEIYVVVPPEPLNLNLYRCDDHFHVEHLEKTLMEKEVYGLISIDVNEAALGLLEGDNIKVLSTYTSGIPGKHRAGGQSARRFERLREMAVHQYFDRIARHVNDQFLDSDLYQRLRGILVGGPGFTKHDFLKQADIDYRLRDKIIEVIDTNYAGEEGLREIVNKASDVLKNVRYVYEKKLIDKFLWYIANKPTMILYGLKPILDHLYDGIIDKLMIIEDFEYYKVILNCEVCGYSDTKYVKIEEVHGIAGTKCPKCDNGYLRVKEEISIIDMLYELKNQLAFDIVLISSKTEYGVIFKQFGGIAAILRYALSY
jgi:peptide chain release factor subunit 1